jgi:L-threonylcarbamoyladenylate synthase
MAADVLPTHTPGLFAHAVARATEVLKAGGVVALPTETVYGLAANALDSAAVAKIYEIKGRPAHNPVIVHVTNRAMALRCAANWPEAADRLAHAFWPGPLTLVVPRSAVMPDQVTAGGDTVGVRLPSHPLMAAVINACGFPLAAPSANLANRLSPTAAAHVVEQLGDRIPLVIDGGDCAVGIESAVVDVTGPAPVLLRPGVLTVDALSAAVGAPVILASSAEGGPLKSPGRLKRHYAPRARLVVAGWKSEPELAQLVACLGADPDRIFILAHTCIPMHGRFPRVAVLPDDPEAVARALYGALHAADAEGAEVIIVEAPPAASEWAGVADRLARGAAVSED